MRSISSTYHASRRHSETTKEEAEKTAQMAGKEYCPDRGGKFLTARALAIKRRLQKKLQQKKLKEV